jgi:hypothetical protein
MDSAMVNLLDGPILRPYSAFVKYIITQILPGADHDNATGATRASAAAERAGRASAAPEKHRRDELVAENGAWNEAVLGHEFSCGDLLAVFVLRLEHLDPPTLSGYEEALRTDFRNLADLALHGAEGPD